jgi:hypothetical protein
VHFIAKQLVNAVVPPKPRDRNSNSRDPSADTVLFRRPSLPY